jgi:hypothetical protein
VLKYLLGSHEPIVGREVDDDPSIPRPVQDRRDRTFESAVDETAGIQVPLVLQLLEDRREQVFRDPFTDLHRYPVPLLWSPKRVISVLPGGTLSWGGSSDIEE